MVEAVSTIERQVNTCELNVVLPISQSSGNQHTNSNQRRWWAFLENGNLRASLRGLRETMNLGEAAKRGIRAGFQMQSVPATRLSSSLPVPRRPLLASAPEGGDRKLGGVKKLPVQRKVEFEGSTKVDFHRTLV